MRLAGCVDLSSEPGGGVLQVALHDDGLNVLNRDGVACAHGSWSMPGWAACAGQPRRVECHTTVQWLHLLKLHGVPAQLVWCECRWRNKIDCFKHEIASLTLIDC